MKLTADTEQIAEAAASLRTIMMDMKQAERNLALLDDSVKSAWKGRCAEGFASAGESLEMNLSGWNRDMDTEIRLIQEYLDSVIQEEIRASNQILLAIKGGGLSIREGLRETGGFEVVQGFGEGGDR